MATTKTKRTKKAATKKAAPAKAKRASKSTPAGERKMSALDAAAKLLGDLNQPLTAKEMIETMAARGLWTSPGGKTPEATLYAAIIREIAKKGDEARFKKHDRGQFVANASGVATKAAGKKPAAKKAPVKKAATKKAATKKAASKKTSPADGTPGPKAVSELFKI